MSILTVLSPLPPEAHTCGYCGLPGQRSAEETNKHSAECISIQMSCQDYQMMIDRGWRRSGTYCYKPDLKRSCCPQYTIKLDALQFKPSRSQRQLINRFNRWVLYGDDRHSGDNKHKGKNNPPFSLEEAIHAGEFEHCNTTGNSQPAHRFEVTIEPSSYTEEKFAVYQVYQKEIHKEQKEKDPRGFKRFLVDNQLHHEDIPYSSTPASHLPRQYGAYHQLYRLDGELIAVGIIDILPNCVSSVYFMYNNKWERFSLGKLSALRELTLTREMHAAGAPGMQFLYMGFYIYSCQKMRYKGEYSPSFLADPEEYTWHPLEECKPLLARYRYACFAHPEHSIEGHYTGPDHDPQISPADLQDVKVVVSVQNGEAVVVPIQKAKEWKRPSVKHAVMTTVEGLGLTLAKDIVFYFAHQF